MRDLPAGTVTFLFTDIAGSTRLLHELGDDYGQALADHRRVLRAVFARHGGVEVDTQGDAFFVAFARAREALAAAAEGQAALKKFKLLSEEQKTQAQSERREIVRRLANVLF